MENGGKAMASPAADCCKQLAEKLEKSEAGRKKLRQAITMLKEKLETMDKVMQLNESLKQECEKERQRAEMQTEKAEKERQARLMLEQDGKSLKETLAAALFRIDSLEASCAIDRKELQNLHAEVKCTAEGFRAAVKVTETAQTVNKNLEKSLTTKVNNILKASTSQNALVQKRLEAVESTVDTMKKDFQSTVDSMKRDLSSVFSRTTALEKQKYQVEAGNSVKKAPEVRKGILKPAEELPKSGPSLRQLPVRTQQQSTQKASARFASSPTGVIEVIPGIRDIVNRPVTTLTLKRPASALKNVVQEKNKAIVVVDTVKDGSDVTDQDVENMSAELMRSITRLFQKEKKTRSKIETKFSELEEAIKQPGRSSSHTNEKKRKRHQSAKGSQKKARKSGNDKKPGNSVEKSWTDGIAGDFLGNSELNLEDFEEGTILLQKWLDTRKNLVSPDLPEVLPKEAPPTQDETMRDKDLHTLRETDTTEEAPPTQNETMRDKDLHTLQETDTTKEDCETGVSTEENLSISTMPEGDKNQEKETRWDCTSDEHMLTSFIQVLLKPPDSWKVEFDTRFASIAPDMQKMPFMSTLTLALINTLAKQHLHQNELIRLAKCTYDVVLNGGIGAGFDTMVRQLCNFLICNEKDANVDQAVVASKLLAALCEFSSKPRLLQKVMYRIFRFSRMDNIMMVTILASVASVWKQSLSNDGLLASTIRCFASELVTEVDSQGYTQDLQVLRGLKSAAEGTTDVVVNAALDILCSAEYSQVSDFDLYGVDEHSEEATWHSRFHEVAACLEIISLQMGWEWTYNEFIVEKLWRLVAPGAAQITVAGVAHLLGSLGRLGLDENGEEMPGVEELRKRLAYILHPQHGVFSLSTRVIAARALLELSIVDRNAHLRWGIDDASVDCLNVLQPEYVVIVKEWFRTLDIEQRNSVSIALQYSFVRDLF